MQIEMIDRYAGSPPNVATMCRECDGMGRYSVWGCEACGGSGKREDMHPLAMALRETADGFVKPFAFAGFMLREYGPREGTPVRALRMVWRDERHNRWALARYVREAAQVH